MGGQRRLLRICDGTFLIVAEEDRNRRETHERPVTRIFAAGLKDSMWGYARLAAKDGLAYVTPKPDGATHDGRFFPLFVVSERCVVTSEPVRRDDKLGSYFSGDMDEARTYHQFQNRQRMSEPL